MGGEQHPRHDQDRLEGAWVTGALVTGLPCDQGDADRSDAEKQDLPHGQTSSPA